MQPVVGMHGDVVNGEAGELGAAKRPDPAHQEQAPVPQAARGGWPPGDGNGGDEVSEVGEEQRGLPLRRGGPAAADPRQGLGDRRIAPRRDEAGEIVRLVDGGQPPGQGRRAVAPRHRAAHRGGGVGGFGHIRGHQGGGRREGGDPVAGAPSGEPAPVGPVGGQGVVRAGGAPERPDAGLPHRRDVWAVAVTAVEVTAVEVRAVEVRAVEVSLPRCCQHFGGDKDASRPRREGSGVDPEGAARPGEPAGAQPRR